jgi:hypothetical protein
MAQSSVAAALFGLAGLTGRMSATIDDKGYLGQLPCLTAKMANPFSFNGG